MNYAYLSHLRSEYWQQLKRKCWRRCEGRCEYYDEEEGERCWNKARDLHHRHYLRFGIELPDDVVYLCRLHHDQAHGVLSVAELEERTQSILQEW